MPFFSFPCFFGDVIFYRSDQLGRHSAHKAVIRHILCHHRACGHYHIVPYGYAGQDGHIPANTHIVADGHRLGYTQVPPPRRSIPPLPRIMSPSPAAAAALRIAAPWRRLLPVLSRAGPSPGRSPIATAAITLSPIPGRVWTASATPARRNPDLRGAVRPYLPPGKFPPPYPLLCRRREHPFGAALLLWGLLRPGGLPHSPYQGRQLCHLG